MNRRLPSAKLVDAVQRLMSKPGDEEAWATFYREMWPFVMAVAYRRLRGRSALVEDVAQEVFIRLALSRPFKNLRSVENLRPYVAAVAENVASTWLRRLVKENRGPGLGDTWESGSGASPESFADPGAQTGQAVELYDLLRGFDESLGERDRELLGFLIDGRSLPDISRTTGLRYPAVAVRVHRLRKRLRKYLISKEISDSAFTA